MIVLQFPVLITVDGDIQISSIRARAGRRSPEQRRQHPREHGGENQNGNDPERGDGHNGIQGDYLSSWCESRDALPEAIGEPGWLE